MSGILLLQTRCIRSPHRDRHIAPNTYSRLGYTACGGNSTSGTECPAERGRDRPMPVNCSNLLLSEKAKANSIPELRSRRMTWSVVAIPNGRLMKTSDSTSWLEGCPNKRLRMH